MRDINFGSASKPSGRVAQADEQRDILRESFLKPRIGASGPLRSSAFAA